MDTGLRRLQEPPEKGSYLKSGLGNPPPSWISTDIVLGARHTHRAGQLGSVSQLSQVLPSSSKTYIFIPILCMDNEM